MGLSQLQVGQLWAIKTGEFRGQTLRVKSFYTSPDCGEQVVLEFQQNGQWCELGRDSLASLQSRGQVVS